MRGAERADRHHGRVRLGARLRVAREASRLSLGDVAARSGVTKSFLSRVERDMSSPSVASLMGICDALGLPVAELFQTPQATVVRRFDRARVAEPAQAADVVDRLITPVDKRHVTVLETTAAPGASGGSTLYTLSSECEVCFILQGTVEVQVQDERFTLQTGDALTFAAAVPHGWRALGDGARILWILAPGLPDPQRSVR